MNDYLKSIILGIVEGLTEFLPVSSTAHIRIAQQMMHIPLDDEYWKMYSVVIQLGAILSVLVYFRRRIVGFLQTFPGGGDGSRTIWTHPLSLVLLAFAITAGPCLLIDKKIGENLESLKVMGWSLIVGGVVMWIVDVWAGRREAAARATADAPQLDEQRNPPHEPLAAPPNFEAVPAAAGSQGTVLGHPIERGPITWRLEDVRFTQAIVIGAAQILAAAFPGTSRSMSTIAAGQLMGLSRPTALEFSFFLSIPVMFAATAYRLLQTVRATMKGELEFAMDTQKWGVLAVGFVVSFIVALAVIAFFMAWVRRRGFTPFAIYRILAGAVVLAAGLGYVDLKLMD